MSTTASRREALGRLPVLPRGTHVVSDNPRTYVVRASCLLALVICVPYLMLGCPPLSPLMLFGLVLGMPTSWVLRRVYQSMPAAQAMTTLVDPEGVVHVVMGRGSVRPLGRRVARNRRPRVLLGMTLGICLVLLGLAAMTALAVVFDQPWVGMVLLGAVLWTLIELVWRIWRIQRRVADGWRVGSGALGAWVAVWVVENPQRRWRRGIPAEELADIARYTPTRSRLKRLAVAQVRDALVIHRSSGDAGG